eukprot:6182256-Pleurochrysis_carterae.AAC.1
MDFRRAERNLHPLQHVPRPSSLATNPLRLLSQLSRPTLSQPDDSVDTDDTSFQEHFQRGLGAYPLRNRTPTALLTVHDTNLPIGTTRNTGCAMLASSSAADPKTRKQALRDDRSGWTAAERAEIANHTENGSWELIDRSAVPPGRAL